MPSKDRLDSPDAPVAHAPSASASAASAPAAGGSAVSGLTVSGPAASPDTTFGAFRRKAVNPPAAVEPASVQVPLAAPDDLVEIGSIGEAYGVKGWVRVFAHAQPGQGGDALLAAKVWWLVNGHGAQAETRAYRILQSRLHSGTVVAQLEGIDGRDIAQAMRGQRVRVPRSSFPALTNGEYYWVDLQGLDVVNPAGQPLGKIADLIDNGAHTVLRVEFATVNRQGEAAKGERMIPFVDAYVHLVDLAARQVVADWDPAWDLDTGEAADKAPTGEPRKKAGKKSGKHAASRQTPPEVATSTDSIAGDVDKS